MQILTKSNFQIPSARRFLQRRIPSGVEIEGPDHSMSMVEDFLAGLSESGGTSSRNILVGFDDFSNSARRLVEEVCGVNDVEVVICNSHIQLLRLIQGDLQVCAGACSGRKSFSNEGFALSNALISSGLNRLIGTTLQTDINRFLPFLPAHGQLVRYQSGRSRIIDHSAVKQATIARLRNFIGNPNRMEVDALRRNDRAEPCGLATFAVFNATGSEAFPRFVSAEALRDEDAILGFSAIERVCAEFARFLVEAEVQFLPNSPTEIVVQVNSHIVADFVARKINSANSNGEGRVIIAPDVMIGWAPELTLLRSLFSDRPIAVLSLQRFPLVEFLYFGRER